MGADAPARDRFEHIAAAKGLFSTAEIDQLIAYGADKLTEARMHGGQDASVRRSSAAWLDPREGFGWVGEKILRAAKGFNDRFFGLDLVGIEGGVQLARYDADNRGFYDWHMDAGPQAPRRKLSISVQLSAPDDYEGGDLEFFFRNTPVSADRDKGLIIAFPSVIMHRVAPVTRGARYSLVAWIEGPAWR